MIVESGFIVDGISLEVLYLHQFALGSSTSLIKNSDSSARGLVFAVEFVSLEDDSTVLEVAKL